MKSQIFVAIGIALFESVLVTGLASTIYARSNMTGGNMSMPSATGSTGDGGGDGDNGDGGDGSDGQDDDEGSN